MFKTAAGVFIGTTATLALMVGLVTNKKAMTWFMERYMKVALSEEITNASIRYVNLGDKDDKTQA